MYLCSTIMSKNLFFSTTAEAVRIPIDTLVYVEADGNYSSIVTVDGSKYVLTVQLGQIEKRIFETVDKKDKRFARIGKSLIVNRDFIVLINPSRQRLVLSDCCAFRHEVSASRDALKVLKEYIEKEEENK